MSVAALMNTLFFFLIFPNYSLHKTLDDRTFTPYTLARAFICASLYLCIKKMIQAIYIYISIIGSNEKHIFLLNFPLC